MIFSDIELVSEQHIAFCKKLGLDVSGDSVGVAAAKIEEAIQQQFWGIEVKDFPTSKQIALAKKFGIDISDMSRLVGNAVINDIMSQLNANSIKEQGLRPGLRVQKSHDITGREYVISSINPDGTVFLKVETVKEHGQKIWSAYKRHNKRLHCRPGYCGAFSYAWVVRNLSPFHSFSPLPARRVKRGVVPQRKERRKCRSFGPVSKEFLAILTSGRQRVRSSL